MVVWRIIFELMVIGLVEMELAPVADMLEVLN